MRKLIIGRLLALSALVSLAFSALCSASAESPGEYATFCYSPLEPSENENRTRRLITTWWPGSISKTPTLLSAASRFNKKHSRTVKFHLANRISRVLFSLALRVAGSFAIGNAVLKAAMPRSEGTLSLKSGAELRLSPRGQEAGKVWSCLSSREEFSPYVALTDSCA